MRFEFRPLGRSDFDLVIRWLADPEVHRWWHHEFTAEAVERDFGPAVDGTDPTDMHLVLTAERDGLRAEPIGLVQSYSFADHPGDEQELAAVIDVPPGTGSIDYLIGEADNRGRGVGTAMIRAYVDRIWVTKPSIDVLIVPVVAANVASWKALAGAGFTRLRQANLEPDNPIDDPLHVIMGLDRPRP
ncbi:MAG: acetyltransferase [Acidimicrobiia bacterium]|nr:acetyltransferase [Acidimicrobiia bacterium]